MQATVFMASAMVWTCVPLCSCQMDTMGVIVGLVSRNRMGRLKIVGMHGGNKSRMACHFCALSGVHIGGSIRQLGYVENTPAKKGKCKDQVFTLGKNDLNRELDHDQQAEHAKGVDAFIAG